MLVVQSIAGPKSLTCSDVLNAVALIVEAARVSKVHPAAMSALLGAPGRATPALIIWDVHCRGAPLWDNERLVCERGLGAEILRSMDAAAFLESLSQGERLLFTAPILHGHCAARYNIEEGPRVTVPGTHLARRKGCCSKRYCCETSDKLWSAECHQQQRARRMPHNQGCQ